MYILISIVVYSTYLLTYLFYSVIVREIVVVSLRWSFKNPSDHRKERRKQQMVPAMYIPILLTYFIPFVKSSLFL